MLKRIVFFSSFLIILSGCNSYERLLKSSDFGKKYDAAIAYYEDGKYEKAYPLLEELSGLFRGTDKAEKIYYYYAWSNYHLEDYVLAAYHFKNFVRTYPHSTYAEECLYMNARCHYLLSPEYSLDQSATISAINEFQLFVDRFPSSEKVADANASIDKLRAKLERKAYEQTKLFYKTENYQSAIVASANTIKDYPGTQYAEELSFIALRSHYLFAVNSIENKKEERVAETLDYYRLFNARFPQSAYSREAEAIRIDASRLMETLAFSIPATYYRRGFYKDAWEAFARALKKYPQSPETGAASFAMLNSLYLLGERSEGFSKVDAYAKLPEAYRIAKPFLTDPAMARAAENIVKKGEERLIFWTEELPSWFFTHRMYKPAIKAAEGQLEKKAGNQAALEEIVLTSWLRLADNNIEDREGALKNFRESRAEATAVPQKTLISIDKEYSRIFAAAPKVVRKLKGRDQYDEAISRARIYLADEELKASHNEIRLLLVETMAEQLLKEKDDARAAKRWESVSADFKAQIDSITGKDKKKALNLLDKIEKKLKSDPS